jgi:hypothetical protein
MQPLDLTSFNPDPNDCTQALQTALNVAKAQGQTVRIKGTWRYRGTLRVDAVELYGEDGALHALDPLQSALILTGYGPAVRDLTLTSETPAGRSSANVTVRVLVQNATNAFAARNTIIGGASAGVMVKNSEGAVVESNSIQNTLADSIHITDRSRDILVVGNVIQNSGDDGIAVVSYRSQGSPVTGVRAMHNKISNNIKGRGMSVVGGRDVRYEYNWIRNNAAAAGLYVARERAYDTFGVSNFLAQRNGIFNCGNKTIDHSAVMIFTDDVEPNENIRLLANLIAQDGVRDGIHAYGQRQTITLSENLIANAVKPLRLATPGVIVSPYAGGVVGPDE